MSALGRMAVLLGLDATEFISGLTEAERKAGLAARKISASITTGMIQAELIINAFPRAIGAAFDKMNESLKVVDSLNDLKDITGDTIEDLASLQLQAAATNNSFDQMTGGLEKLALNLAGTDDEGRGAGRALQELEIDARNADKSLKGAAQVTTEVAAALNLLADGGGKAALVTDLYGKQGVKLLPVLKDLAEGNKLISGTTTQQAEAVETLLKAQARSRAQLDESVKQISIASIPTMIAFRGAIFETATEILGLRDKSGELLKGEELKSWAENAGKVLDNVGDAVQFIARSAKTLTDALGATAAQAAALASLNFSGVAEIGKASAEKRQDIFAGDSFSEIRKRNRIAAEFDAQLARQEAAKNGGKDARPQSDYTRKDASAGRNAGGGGKGKDEDADFKSYLDNLQRQVQKTDELTASEKLLDDIRRGKLSVTGQQKEELEGLAKILDAQKQQAIALQDQRAVSIAAGDEVLKANQAYQTQLTSLLSATPTAVLDKQRNDVKMLTEEFEASRISEELYLQAVTARLNLTGEKVDEAAKKWADFESASKSAFEGMLTGSKDPLKSLNELIKRELLDTLYALTLKPWIVNVKSNMSGGGSGGSGGGGGGFLGMILGTVVDSFFGDYSGSSSDPLAANYVNGMDAASDAAGGGIFSGLKFEGGGDTGSGPRSGGLDGKGGFMAMMHPQETVIDRTLKGGGGGMVFSPTTTINIGGGSDTAQLRAEFRQSLAARDRQLQKDLQDAGVLG